jgi:hypothetical protein
LRRSGSPNGRGSGTATGDPPRVGVRDGGRAPARSGAPYLVPAALATAAAIAIGAGWGRIASCGASLEAPDTQIRKALAHQGRAHLADVYGFRGGGTVELVPVRFTDVTTSVERGRATVVAMLSAEGRVVWRDEEARLAYLGREQFHMQPCSIALWCGEGDQFARLRGVLVALFRRHDAMRAGDVDAYGRLLAAGYRDGADDRSAALRRAGATLPAMAGRVRVVGWQIRVDRSGAEVGEDLALGDGPAPARAERHVLRLARDGERWVFTGGM